MNQIFGSRTEPRDERWRLEVPAGESGIYTLVLTGLADGPFFVTSSERSAACRSTDTG